MLERNKNHPNSKSPQEALRLLRGPRQKNYAFPKGRSIVYFLFMEENIDVFKHFHEKLDCRRLLRRRSLFVKNTFVCLTLPNCRFCLQFEQTEINRLLFSTYTDLWELPLRGTAYRRAYPPSCRSARSYQARSTVSCVTKFMSTSRPRSEYEIP